MLRSWRDTVRRAICGASVAAASVGVALAARSLPAQVPGVKGRYQPINQTLPVGTAGRWSTFQDPAGLPCFQPVQFVLPTAGTVTILQGGPQGVAQKSPAQAALSVGHTYRLKISDMPEYPGAELYPSIEVLDRLHPPPGREHEFPVPLDFTREEIDDALDGRLVTKVIYVEQPSLATPVQQDRPIAAQLIGTNTNLLAQADVVGRPMLLVRLGGRQPDPRAFDHGFYGAPAPVAPSVPPQRPHPGEPHAPQPQPPGDATSPVSPEDASREGIEPMSATRPAGMLKLRDTKPSDKRFRLPWK